MAKAATATKTAPDSTVTAPKTNAPRVAPIVTNASNSVAMPERSSNRGSKTSYPFESLSAVGMSYGVKNKTALQMSSIVSNQNRKPGAIKKDANGATIFKTQKMDMGDGTSKDIPTSEPDTLPGKHYFAMDVDPKKDPDGASVRVWRDA